MHGALTPQNLITQHDWPPAIVMSLNPDPSTPVLPAPPRRPRTCQQCGTASTAQWRYGYNGNFLMCNACGIRWRRKHHGGSKRRRSTQRAPPASAIHKRTHTAMPPPPPPPPPMLPPPPLHTSLSLSFSQLHEQVQPRSHMFQRTYSPPIQYPSPPRPPSPYMPPTSVPCTPPLLQAPHLASLPMLGLDAMVAQAAYATPSAVNAAVPRASSRSPLSIRSLLNTVPAQPSYMSPNSNTHY